MSLRSIRKAFDNLIKWSGRDEWKPLWTAVHKAHCDAFFRTSDSSSDPLAEMDEDFVAVLEMFVLEDFFNARFGDDNRNVIDDYLKRRGWRETPAARRYLEALRDSVPSLYKIVDVMPGKSVVVRDLMGDGAPVTVEDEIGFELSMVGEYFAGRVLSVDGVLRLSGGLLSISDAMAAALLSSGVTSTHVAEVLREVRIDGKDPSFTGQTAPRLPPLARRFSQAWLVELVRDGVIPPPNLRNSDNEGVVLCHVRVPVIGDRAHVISLLDGDDELERDGNAGWRWLDADSPSPRAEQGRHEPRESGMSQAAIDTKALGYAELRDGMLVMTANSVERAERARVLLASRLGELVGPARVERLYPAAVPHLPDTPSGATASTVNERSQRSTAFRQPAD